MQTFVYFDTEMTEFGKRTSLVANLLLIIAYVIWSILCSYTQLDCLSKPHFIRRKPYIWARQKSVPPTTLQASLHVHPGPGSMMVLPL